MAGNRRKRSVEVAGVAHSAPIPMGAVVGNMLFSSAIMGSDPATGKPAAEPAAQAKFAFENLQSLVRNAGFSLDDIGKLSVFITDNSMRQHVNDNWLKLFPDEHDRPARHIIVQPLPGGMLVQIELVAVKAA